jgi:intracellular septation protein A
MLNLLRAFKPIAGDFLSTIIFIAIYEVTNNIVIATSFGIVTGIGQFLWLKSRKQKIELMQWASLILVIVLGSATLLTKDPRFVMLKPSIAGFAVACVMLQRGWQLRYMPPLVKENASEGFLVLWGYLWSAMYFVTSAVNLYVALRLGTKVWAEFNAVVLTFAPLVMFAIQYTTMRIVIGRTVRARIAAGTMAMPPEYAK